MTLRPGCERVSWWRRGSPRRAHRQLPLLRADLTVAVQIETALELGLVLLPFRQQGAHVRLGVELRAGAAKGGELADGVETVVRHQQPFTVAVLAFGPAPV